MSGVVAKPYLKLLFCLSRGDRRFEKPGRKDPGMVLLLCGQKAGGRSRVCFGEGSYIYMNLLLQVYCWYKIHDTVSGYLIVSSKCWLSLFCVVFTTRHLNVLDKKNLQ